ncbi:unnamed protein product [Phaedon cochleariae]|uniref:Kynurenine formamidase n=1 Tax=Phaedon cochleariae TaxID=80249 RepID=A0A9P0DXK9_PHACE|nr:unnamed protein product [Phaedon cochleariae]
MSQLEIDYSPSRWSKRLKADQILVEHLKITSERSRAIEKEVPCDLNIPYGPGKREVIDIYGTDLLSDAPIFIIFHGGYWQEQCIKHNDFAFMAKNLYEKNIKSIYVGYELCPDVTIKELQRNTEKAMRKCLEYVRQFKPKGIHLSGHSAGAQIVANFFANFIHNLAEEDRELFKSVFLLGGIYDLTPLLSTSYNIPLGLDQQLASEASPLLQNLAADGTVFHVVVAENDSPPFIEQGKLMHKHLQELKIDSKYIFVQNVDHFDLIEKLYERDYELTKLIISNCVD